MRLVLAHVVAATLAFTLGATALQAQDNRRAERRVALVIGNATYKADPLDNPVNDARLIAKTLTAAGFQVTLREDLDRRGLFEAMRAFGNQLNEDTVALFYYAGHGLQLRDRNYLVPIDAEIQTEDEIPVSALDVGFILDRMASARSRVNIVILDACRNNPFAGRTKSNTQGLAQMDAPVGTLLAFATAPGKLAADGQGSNGWYASHLAQQMVVPGVPIEIMFRRVREGVVKESREQQIPWESSSLRGEFAFVPGTAPAIAAPRETLDPAAADIAFWESIKASSNALEYRAYLAQFPQGKFAALARARIDALAVASAHPPAQSAAAGRAELLPRPGDTWRYKVQDRFRLGDLFVTARVDDVRADGVAESWSTSSNPNTRGTGLAPLAMRFHALPGWDLTPPEFAPYLQAHESLRAGQSLGSIARRVGNTEIALSARVEAEEELSTPAGRFQTVKVSVRNREPAARGNPRAQSVEYTVWYAAAAKRPVKIQVTTRTGSTVQEEAVLELVEFKLN